MKSFDCRFWDVYKFLSSLEQLTAFRPASASSREERIYTPIQRRGQASKRSQRETFDGRGGSKLVQNSKPFQTHLCALAGRSNTVSSQEERYSSMSSKLARRRINPPYKYRYLWRFAWYHHREGQASFCLQRQR